MDGLKILIKQIDKKQLGLIKAIAVARAVQKNSEIQGSLSQITFPILRDWTKKSLIVKQLGDFV
jgi:hypothetical protein